MNESRRWNWGCAVGALALCACVGWNLPLFASQSEIADRKTVLVLVGAAGEPEFATNFLQQAEHWKAACEQAGCLYVRIGLESSGASNDLEQVKAFLEAEPRAGASELWIALIGHGTFDGKESRFNLRGPDLSAMDLAEWLKPFRRPIAIINTTASSSPFLNKLSATNRVVITATRSGNEQSFARFGEYFAKAVASPEADLDKDGQTSVLEGFLMASRKATEFYKIEGRLATEHALLDDNGDGAGTPADWFKGVRAVKKAQEKSTVDGLFAHQWHLVPGTQEKTFTPEQQAMRNQLERAVLAHREKKSQLPEETYYAELEKLLLNLARFYETNAPATSRLE